MTTRYKCHAAWARRENIAHTLKNNGSWFQGHLYLTVIMVRQRKSQSIFFKGMYISNPMLQKCILKGFGIGSWRWNGKKSKRMSSYFCKTFNTQGTSFGIKNSLPTNCRWCAHVCMYFTHLLHLYGNLTEWYH
jgi:hypothetical protein